MHKIGVVAKRVGISHDTVRLYERYSLIGVPIRSENGYRLYDDIAIEKLMFIKHMKSLGFTLNEIKELLDIEANSEKQCKDVKDMLSAKIKAIKEKILALEELNDSLQTMMTLCAKPLKKDQCPILMSLNKGDKS